MDLMCCNSRCLGRITCRTVTISRTVLRSENHQYSTRTGSSSHLHWRFFRIIILRSHGDSIFGSSDSKRQIRRKQCFNINSRKAEKLDLVTYTMGFTRCPATNAPVKVSYTNFLATPIIRYQTALESDDDGLGPLGSVRLACGDFRTTRERDILQSAYTAAIWVNAHKYR